MFPAKLGYRDTAFRLAKNGKDLWFAKSARLIEISSIIKPEKIPLLKPLNGGEGVTARLEPPAA